MRHTEHLPKELVETLLAYKIHHTLKLWPIVSKADNEASPTTKRELLSKHKDVKQHLPDDDSVLIVFVACLYLFLRDRATNHIHPTSTNP